MAAISRKWNRKTFIPACSEYIPSDAPTFLNSQQSATHCPRAPLAGPSQIRSRRRLLGEGNILRESMEGVLSAELRLLDLAAEQRRQVRVLCVVGRQTAAATTTSEEGRRTRPGGRRQTRVHRRRTTSDTTERGARASGHYQVSRQFCFCMLICYHRISEIIHIGHIRAALFFKCFSSGDSEVLSKADCTCVRPISECLTLIWSRRMMIEFVKRC